MNSIPPDNSLILESNSVHFIKPTIILYDFLEKNAEVQTALEAKNEEFARFSKEVEAVATEHECEVHRVWNVIDTNSVFHD